MKKFIVTVPVKAQGHQCYSVEAKSAKEAIALISSGGGQFEYQDLEVHSCDFNHAEANEDDK